MFLSPPLRDVACGTLEGLELRASATALMAKATLAAPDDFCSWELVSDFAAYANMLHAKGMVSANINAIPEYLINSSIVATSEIAYVSINKIIRIANEITAL